MPLRLLIAGSVVLAVLPLAGQQQDSPPPSQQSQAAPSSAQKKDQPKKSAAQENPFPEAQSEEAAHQAQQQDSGSAPNAPQPQTPPQAGSSAKPSDSGQNPFPEAQSEAAAHQGQQQTKGTPPAPSGSSQQNYSSSHVKGLDMPTTDETPPSDLPPSSLPYNPKLARKDVEVGDYYLDTGNWQGAYDRFFEANRSDPGNAEAVYGLADSARHLHRHDEAVRNYRLYLLALPNGPRAKDVRRALKEMDAAPAS
jgi:tetratricopeptide (TPR) repeat protein